MAAAAEVVCNDIDGPKMPSSNFARTRRRRHSGRITQNSENWLTPRVEEVKQAPPVIANSENYHLSRGKKVNIAKDAGHAKGRLTMDSSEPAETWQQTQRRHNFPEQVEQSTAQPCRRHPGVVSHPVVGVAAAALQGGRAACGLVDAQHRTSAEMAATIMPEMQAHVPKQSKYFVGSEIVDWQNNGRRNAPDCALHAVQVGLPARMMNMAKLRDHRNSDAIRDHLQQGPVRVNAAPPPPVVVADGHTVAARRAAVPTSVPTYMSVASTTTGTSDPHIHSFGEFSMLPSSTSKDAAYSLSGLHNVKYGTRSAGACSPNAQRMPVSQIVSL